MSGSSQPWRELKPENRANIQHPESRVQSPSVPGMPAQVTRKKDNTHKSMGLTLSTQRPQTSNEFVLQIHGGQKKGQRGGLEGLLSGEAS